MQADLKKIYGGGAAGAAIGGLLLLNNQYYDDIEIQGDRFLKCGLIETDESKFDTSLFKTRMPKYQPYLNKNFSIASKMLNGGLRSVKPVEVAGVLYTIHDGCIVRIDNIFNFSFTVLAELPELISSTSKLFSANGDLILAALGSAGVVSVFSVDRTSGAINIIGSGVTVSSVNDIYVGDISGGHLVVALAASNTAYFYRSTKASGSYGSFDNIGTIANATTGGALIGVESGRPASKTNCYFTVATASKVYNVTSSAVTTDTTTRALGRDIVFSQFANKWLLYDVTQIGKCFYSADANITSAFTATATDMFNIAAIGTHAVGFSYSGSTVDIRRLNADGSVPSQQTLSLTCQIEASTASGQREANLEVIHDLTGGNTYILAGFSNTTFSSILHSSTGLSGFSCKSAINNSTNLLLFKNGAETIIAPIADPNQVVSNSYFLVTTDFVNFEFKYQSYAGSSAATKLYNVAATDDGVSVVAARALASPSSTLKMSAINKSTKVVSADVDSGVPAFDIARLDFICGKYVMFNTVNTPVKTATALNSWSAFTGYNMLVKNGANAYAINGNKLYSTSNLTAFSLIHTFAATVAFFDIKNGRAFARLVNGQVLTSTNFTTWVAVNLSTSGSLKSVDYLNGLYVASVGSEYEYSSDGITFDAGLEPFVYNDGLLPYDNTLMSGVYGKFAGGMTAFSQGSGDQYMRIS